jgi:hypothetical protein
MTLGIKINVIHIITEEDSYCGDIDIQIKSGMENIEQYTFYTIDYVKKYSKEMAIISSAGLDFVINETYESVNKRIQECQTFRFN